MNHLLISHPNMKNTGAAVRFELYPAQDGIEGAIVAILAPQKTVGVYSQDTITPPTFDWCNCVNVRLSPLEVAAMLEVLRGYHESVANGQGFFHRTQAHTRIIRFEHKIDPVPCYQLHVKERDIATDDYQEIKICFAMTEAILLSEVFASSLVRMTFGE